MSYTINLTNGTTLVSLVDGTIDQTTTDLTLISKNATSYGLYLNDNLVHLLENFANTTQPANPLIGQLWFDTTQNRLKVYDGLQFKVSGGSLVSNTVPSSITTGDIWINSKTSQLYFNDGLQNVLCGPLYTSTQGRTGFYVEDVIDINNLSHTVAYVYVAGTPVGVFTKEAFTPGTALNGFTGSFVAGFNIGNLAGLQFNVPVKTASQLVDVTNTIYTPASFIQTTNSQSMTGTLTIQNATPLILGATSSNQINVTNAIFQMASNYANQNFEIGTVNSSGYNPSINIVASSKYVGIFNNNPQATLDVIGTAKISGLATLTTGVVAGSLRVTTSSTPASSSANGTTGQIQWDSNYVYVCVATNTWKRAALASW